MRVPGGRLALTSLSLVQPLRCEVKVSGDWRIDELIRQSAAQLGLAATAESKMYDGVALLDVNGTVSTLLAGPPPSLYLSLIHI